MRILHSHEFPVAERSPRIAKLLETIAEKELRQAVERISVPRHFVTEPEQNRATANWLSGVFESLNYHVERQGQHANILALPKNAPDEVILVGAHYDSVPMCPGADDNGSAVAAMLSCAAASGLWRPELPIIFAAFNREEEALLGSRDFVSSYLSQASFKVQSAHILEMVGYASSEPHSQRVPTGLPIKLNDKGDFLGLLANAKSRTKMDFVLSHARAYLPDLPVIGLGVQLDLEKLFPVLARSDHVPFWAAEIPAVMWTDTSEFRNENYHRHTDTPDTLNYSFLQRVTQLLTASVIHEAAQLSGRHSAGP